MNQTPSLLRLRNMRKAFQTGGAGFELVVDSFALEPGKVTALVGRSGSGKSTLLDILALLTAPDEVADFELSLPQFNGPVDLNELLARRDESQIAELRLNHFGYVLQHGGLLQFLSVAENIFLPARAAQTDPDRAYVEALAKEFGVLDQYNKLPNQLSGGQKQRVAILRALSRKPSIILCDEPTAAVDEFTATSILEQLTEKAEKFGTAVLLVSHDLQLVQSFAHSVYHLAPEQVEPGLVRSKLSLGLGT